MSRIKFLIVLLGPFFLTGLLFPEHWPEKILPFLIIFYIPIITLIRMMYIKMGWKDILKSQKHLQPIPETINFNGLHTGKRDPYGELFSEHVLTINLRSQLNQSN
jgi:hypothetical protein